MSNIRTLVIDAFHKIECQDQTVIRIKANHRCVNVIKDFFKDEFDEEKNEHLRRLIPNWTGSLFGAHIEIDNDLEQIVFEGDHGTITSISFDITKKELNVKQQDTKRKFRFILEEK